MMFLLALLMVGVEPTVSEPGARKRPAGIVCECGRKIPFSWSSKLIEGDQGDIFEVECFGCGAVWHVSQEKAPGGKPKDPVRRIPIELRLNPDGTLREVLYRGKPAVAGKDYTTA